TALGHPVHLPITRPMLQWILIALLLVSPYLLTQWSKRRALRDGTSTSGGWFTFLQKVQWTVILYTGCWPAAWRVLGDTTVPWLTRRGLAAWVTPVTIASILLPLLAFQVFAVVSIQSVNRAIRGSEVSGDEVLSDQLRGLAGVGILLVALC